MEVADGRESMEAIVLMLVLAVTTTADAAAAFLPMDDGASKDAMFTAECRYHSVILVKREAIAPSPAVLGTILSGTDVE